MASSYKENIATLNTDYSSEVVSGYNAVKQQLQNVRTENLEGTNRALPTQYSDELESTYTRFVQNKPKKKEELSNRLAEVKKRHMIFLAIKLVLILLGIIMIFVGSGQEVTMYGVLVLIAGIICHFIFKSIDNKKSEEIADAWIHFFIGYVAIFGSEETLHSEATGLYKKVDELYLLSLDNQTRGFELQNRQMKKQMQAQQEQHEQAMEMQAQQTAMLTRQLSEINNSLYRK